jgi:serine/threonine-protein kinase
VPPAARFCPRCGEAATAPDAPTLAPPDPPGSGAGPVRFGDSSDAHGDSRFVPGQMVGDRYRIVALIGRGGMGEVYRADDLRLAQTVALKFLPENLARDGAALARFHREVRIARQVSHPNICRVFDIGEAANLSYLSMEYVDGEDLAALLRRIGRLPQDKAVEIARQLCAGLAAAHDAGVLHRDLKPSNVMLDGRGKARITDFGLAAIRGDEGAGGTPAYMAPEQLRGRPATVQSDLYALGLVLYEMFTGKPAFTASSLAELLRLRTQSTPISLTKLVSDVDPVVDRVIMRCLAAEPDSRPSSALQVAMALPGGDPLAAALAAGETPSPEMVAAAGGKDAMRPAKAWALLGATLASLVVVLFLARYSNDLNLAPPPKTPDALEDRAQGLLKRLGYTEAPADHAAWFERAYDFLKYRAEHIPSPQRVRELSQAEVGVMYYYYRQSPRPLIGSPVSRVITALDPPQEVSGMTTVLFDSQGRLIGFLAVPPQVIAPEARAAAGAEMDWSPLFAEAGLDYGHFERGPPRWLPPQPFDREIAWNGTYPQHPETPVHVIGASYAGRPVYFQVIGPWSQPWRMQAERIPRSTIVAETSFLCAALATLVIAAVLARRNLRLGRGDRRGAFRVAAVLFSATMAAALLVAHYVPDVMAEWTMVTVSAGSALLIGSAVWLYYIALEPYVRRQWPESLISWNRLLSGGFRDPRVGRDLLVGTLAGCAIAIFTHLYNALPAWIHVMGETPIGGNPHSLESAARMLGVLLGGQIDAIFSAFTIMFLLFLGRATLPRRWLSPVIVAVILSLTSLGQENFALETPAVVLISVLKVAVLMRYGIQALVVAIFASQVLIEYPLVLDSSRWYSAHSMFALAVVLGLSLYGFYTALAGQPLFGKPALEKAG